MPEDEDPPSPTLPAELASIVVTRSDTYKTIYSDLIRTRLGAGDITIIFSRATHSPSILAAATLAEEQTEIIMSLPQLKMFEQILRSIVDAFEQEVGVISIPLAFKVNAETQRQAIRSLGLPSAEHVAPDDKGAPLVRPEPAPRRTRPRRKHPEPI